MQPSITQSFHFQNNNHKQLAFTTNTPYHHNSSFPFNLNENFLTEQMETSFQANISDEYVEFVWKASIKYLKNCLTGKFDETKGFLDGQIFQPALQNRGILEQRKKIIELIEQIPGLSSKDKQILSSALIYSRNLKKLFEGLLQMFGQEIINQFIFVLKYAWEKYTAFKLSKKYSSQLSLLVFPAFKSINIEKIEHHTKNQPQYFEETTEKQMIENADEMGSYISATLFIDNKIRYINLKDAEKVSNDSNKIRKQFEIFMKSIAKAIFSCIQGFFCQQQIGILDRDVIEQRASFFSQLEQNLNQGRKQINL